MRKILLALTICLTFIFTGCISEDNYINTVKEIPISEEVLGSKTTEELAVNFMERVIKEKLSLSKLKWEIEGETKEGKMVVAEYKGNKIYFATVKNGDYIQYAPIETYLVTENGNRITLAETIYNEALNEFSKAFNF